MNRVVLLCAALLASPVWSAEQRPNILWLFAEDTSPWLGCYGHQVNHGHTPHLDRMAERGVRFSRAFVPAPVCSPCRSALMAGQNQIRFGAHQHRSSRGPVQIHLPDQMKLLPQLIKDSGYFTFNLGKTDYNFVWDQSATYSLSRRARAPIPWQQIKNHQPFFGQIQLAGGKNRTDQFPAHRKTDPAAVTVPADYPQNDVYRQVVAQHCDAIRQDDDFVGEVWNGLRSAGIADNTIVVYFSDHGANHLVRHKQMVTEGGLHVPLIVIGPDPYVPAPSVRDDLVNLLDLSATTLAWAGVTIPSWYEGQDLFGTTVVPRSFVAAAKDRMDHSIDRVRSIRTDRYRYTRNYKTDRILLQPQYRDKQPYLVHLRQLYASGALSPKLTEIYFGERPAEELYDVRTDPSQTNNLARDPDFEAELIRHRQLLDQWLARGDAGVNAESIDEIRFQAGGDQGHKWGQAVNPEYEIVRADSDGDGLSDDWERINGRDSDDGRLLFRFDCGGWQTEGWSGSDDLGNIAGRQGFLDFVIGVAPAVIKRSDLRLSTAINQGALVLTARTDQQSRVDWLATHVNEPTARLIGSAELPGSDQFVTRSIAIPTDDTWHGNIGEIQLVWSAAPGTTVEIDTIEIK